MLNKYLCTDRMEGGREDAGIKRGGKRMDPCDMGAAKNSKRRKERNHIGKLENMNL